MALLEESIIYSRWQSFCAICLYMSIAGTVYAFNIYGELMKSELGYTQSVLSVIASVGNSGNLFALPIGFGIERFGNRSTMYFGCTCVFVGYLFIWLALIKYHPSSVESVTLFYFVSQVGICCFVATAITSSIKLFPPESRGTAIGLCRAYFGLSSAVLGDLAGGTFLRFPNHFVLFVAFFIPIVGLVGVNMSSSLPAHLVSFDYEHSCDQDTSLTRVFYHWNFLFAVLFAVGYAQYTLELNTTQLSVCSSVVLISVLSLMFLPGTYGSRIIASPDAEYKSLLGSFDGQQQHSAATAVKTSGSQLQGQGGEDGLVMRRPSPSSGASSGSLRDFFEDLVADPVRTAADGTDNLLSSTQKPSYSSFTNLKDYSHLTVTGDCPAPYRVDDHECFYGPSLTIQQAVHTWRYWALFMVFLVICGSGLLVIYNASDIALSAGGQASAFYVTVFALGNGMGKVVSGMVSDWCVKNRFMSTLELLAVVALSMAVVHALLALGWSSLTFPCFFWVGLANGCAVSLVSVATTDLFGHRYIATTLAIIDNAPLVGSYFFSTALIAMFYRVNSTDPLSGAPTCLGGECFRTPFLICAAFCGATAVLCAYMHRKTPLK